MTIPWSLVAPGLLLLLFPADRLLSSLVELRSFESFRSLENSPRHRPWWWVPLLWLDPIRGLAGTLLLKEAVAAVSNDWMLARNPLYWGLIGVLGAGVLIQVFTRRGEGVLLAPIGFAAGVVAALVPWPVTAIGLVTGIAGLFAFRQFHAFFSIGLVAIGILGFVLEVNLAWLAPAIGVMGLPIIAGFLTGCALELPVRTIAGPLRPPSIPA